MARNPSATVTIKNAIRLQWTANGGYVVYRNRFPREAPADGKWIRNAWFDRHADLKRWIHAIADEVSPRQAGLWLDGLAALEARVHQRRDEQRAEIEKMGALA